MARSHTQPSVNFTIPAGKTPLQNCGYVGMTLCLVYSMDVTYRVFLFDRCYIIDRPFNYLKLI